MKRFSIFFAALFAAVTSFAAVTYELNGGVTNDYGWLDKSGMYATLLTDINAITPSSNAGFSDATLEGDKAKGSVSKGIPTYWSDLAVLLTNETFLGKWGWLVTYMDGVCTEQSKSLPSSSSTYLRYNLGAFFLEADAETYLHAKYNQAGLIEAFQPAWKAGFANPTEPTAEFVLNTPYYEGKTFDGWYAAADFSGEKVTKVDATTTGTLYAKWIDYISTVAEVHALADSTEAKTMGVVNFISGRNVWIQDASAGILVYTAETPSCKVGDKITVKGEKVMYNGAPEITGAVIEATEAGELFAIAQYENLAALVADSLDHKYFATRVKVPGVTIVEYDGYNNPIVQDALGNKAKCYKMVLDPTAFPIGTNVIVTGVAAWHNGFQFVGNAADIKVAGGPVLENFTYPTRAEGRYSLKNNWVVSMMEDNYTANKPGSTDYVRGMAAKDGIMYFINRETMSIVRVDGKTGNMLEPLKLQGTDTLFKYKSVDSLTNEVKWNAGVTLAYNDIKFDQGGNCLIGACMEGKNKCQHFMIYVVNLETGVCTLLIDDVLWENPGLNQVQFRFDAFGAAGDVTKNGVVMAADASGSWNVYRWLITDGVAGEGKQVAVLIDPAVDQSLFVNASGFNTAPQIFPQDEEGNLFYVDGFNTLPMLFYGNPEEGAKLVDDFINVPTGVKVWNNGGDTIAMNPNFNGLVEFQVGEEYFLLMVATNNEHAGVKSSYALYKFADADRMFSGMEPLWYFPHNGLGTITVGCRTAVPSVDVVSDTEATLYLYTTNNGYAAYTLTITPDDTAVEDIESVKVGAEKVIENGQIFILKNGVKYNALGAQVK